MTMIVLETSTVTATEMTTGTTHPLHTAVTEIEIVIGIEIGTETETASAAIETEDETRPENLSYSCQCHNITKFSSFPL